jgi:transposase
MIYVGADVAKSKIDIHAQNLNLPPVVTNDEAGLAKLISACEGHQIHVVCEATGAYHRALRDACHAAGIPISIINPARVRAFARSDGLLAKTDRLDARILARFGLDPLGVRD